MLLPRWRPITASAVMAMGLAACQTSDKPSSRKPSPTQPGPQNPDPNTSPTATPRPDTQPDGPRDVLMVGNSVSGTVTVVDAKTYAALGTINVIPDVNERLGEIEGNFARRIIYNQILKKQLVKVFEPSDGKRFVDDLFLSPDGTRLYVSRSNLGDVAAFDLSRAGYPMLWRSTVSLFKADHATISPDGSRLVVSASGAGTAHVMSTADGNIIGSFDTGKLPHQNDYSHDGKRIYNGSLGNLDLPYSLNGLKGDRQLTVVDAETLQIIRTYDFDRGVRPTVIMPDEKIAYMQLSYLNGVVKYDLEAGRIIATSEQPLNDFARRTYPDEDYYPHNSAHHGLALSGDGSLLCDAGTISNTVSLVSTATMKVEATIDVGMIPYWATTSADGNVCFVSLSGDDQLSVIDYRARREIARVPTGKFPQRSRVGRMPKAVVELLSR